MSIRLTPLLLLLPASAMAIPYTWPGAAAPCNGTLQACIDGVADGSTVQVASSTIAEYVVLNNRSLTLMAASGYAPAFASGYSLSVSGDSGAPATIEVSVRGFDFGNAGPGASYTGSGIANITFAQLSAGMIDVAAYSGTVNATLTDNRVRGVPSSDFSGLISLNGYQGAAFSADVYYNRVTSTAATSAGAGILFAMGSSTGAGSGTVKLHGNEVRGGFLKGGILVSEGLASSTASHFNARVFNNVVIGDGDGSTLDKGIAFAVGNGSINGLAFNNTLTRCYGGVVALRWPGAFASGAQITGSIINNLIVADIGIDTTASASINTQSNDYNLINAGFSPISGAALGAHTLTAPAQLVLDTAPRLRAASPAIDAADSTTLGLALALNTLPISDADNTRRFKGATNKADIGAYEFGDAVFAHTTTASNVNGGYSQTTAITDDALNGLPTAIPMATPRYLGVNYNHPFGAYYDTGVSRWRLFNEDFTNPMPLGANFDLFVPAAGDGAFTHDTTAGNISGLGTVLDNTATNSLPDRIVLVTQNWVGTYDPHPVGVFYGGDARWHIANLDGATMSAGQRFDVFAQEPGPNAFVVSADNGNTISGTYLMLHHPLLDDTPCALPQVTRVLGLSPTIADNFDVRYVAPHWAIYGYGARGIQPGDAFDVFVDARQVFDCTDRIFADGFEAR